MSDWRRCNRSHPCPICGKPDWCSVSGDGVVANCMRVENCRPVAKGGWLHDVAGGLQALPPKADNRPRLMPEQCERMHAKFQLAMTERRLYQLADLWRLPVSEVARIEPGWDSEHERITIPMRDENDKVIGFSTRERDGRKLAITGSRNGLFVLAWTAEPEDVLVICEGASDTVAMGSLDIRVVGRQSCCGQVSRIMRWIANHTECCACLVAVFADQDEPGIRGATELARRIGKRASVVLPPPGIKDARAWVNAGATRAHVVAAIHAKQVTSWLMSQTVPSNWKANKTVEQAPQTGMAMRGHHAARGQPSEPPPTATKR